MSAGQLARVELTSAFSAGQVARVEITTPAVDASAGQVARVEVTTPPYTTVNLGPARVVDGLELVTIDASTTGAAATSWTWQVQSAVAGGVDISSQIVLAPDNDQCTFFAPATNEGATVVIGASASNGTTTSPLATLTVTVYPHLEWERIGGAWVPIYDGLV